MSGELSAVSLPAVLVATFAAFAIGSAWYVAFGERVTRLRGAGDPDPEEAASPPPWKLAAEGGRCALVAVVLASLAALAGADDLGDGILLGLVLWAGFPLVLLAGSALWEGVDPRLAAIHAGDWLVKLVALGGLLAAWQA